MRSAVTEKAAPGKRTQEGTPTPIYVAPKAKVKVKPVYTAEGLSEGIEGKVILLATISAKGRVIKSKVIKGLGYGLDKAAQAALKQWLYSPATRGGQPVKSNTNVTVIFVIE